ncbi:MAG TPA: hypothetical protein VG844_05710 [Terracidiphilus sp.]|nr:hypothetical protein [Terracidiphilus sp.]
MHSSLEIVCRRVACTILLSALYFSSVSGLAQAVSGDQTRVKFVSAGGQQQLTVNVTTPLQGAYLVFAGTGNGAEIVLLGKSLADKQKISVQELESSSKIVQDTGLVLLGQNTGIAHGTLTPGNHFDPGKTYLVSLYEGTGDAQRIVATIPLDLEYYIRQKVIADLAPNLSMIPNPNILKFSQTESARQMRRKAKKLSKQIQSSQKAISAVIGAAEIQRQLYLQAHPEITSPSFFPFGVAASEQKSTTQSDGGSNPYCPAGSATESAYIHVRRSLVDPKEASDSYGRRLGRRFIVFEITVENTNPNLQYMLHDVSVDLSRLHNVAPGTFRWAFSSQDLIMLRGVPEKGTDYDPRNLALHLTRGVGSVAGGVAGLTADGIREAYSGSVAAFNGPFLTSYLDIFPDHTATQLNRLSDSAFTANTVVAKQSAKTFAIFVPENLFMTSDEQSAYWKNPVSVFDTPWLDFRQADVCVDGTFISEVPALTLATAKFDEPDKVANGAQSAITVTGSNLAVGDTLVDVFGVKSDVSSVDANGTSAKLTVTVPKDTDLSTPIALSLESKKTGYGTPVISISLPPVLKSVRYQEIDSPSIVVAFTADHVRDGGDIEVKYGESSWPAAGIAKGSGTAQISGVVQDQLKGAVKVSLHSKSSGLDSNSMDVQIVAPTLESASIDSKSNENNVVLDIKGQNLISDDTQVEIQDSNGNAIGTVSLKVTDGISGTATFSGITKEKVNGAKAALYSKTKQGPKSSSVSIAASN